MNTDVNNHSTAFGWIGIATVAAFCMMWVACYMADSSWTWGVDTLSEFGVSEKAADYFNYGMVVVGLILSVYGLGKAIGSKYVGFTVGGNLMAVSGIFVAMVGLLPLDVGNGDYHKFAVIVAATLLLAGLVSVTVQQHYNGMVIPVGIAIVLVISAMFCAFEFGLAKAEVYCLVLAAVWIATDAVCMIVTGIKGTESQ